MTDHDARPVLFTFLGTPVKWLGVISLPTVQAITWAITTHLAARNHPERGPLARIATGYMNMLIFLGSEWGHNMAHIVSAKIADAPMDEMLIYGGMPRVQFFINDERITPRQHRLRALGGPTFNAAQLVLGLLLRALTRPGTLLREAANTLTLSNAFLATAAWTPVPGLDGGPMLKWTLVARGHTPEEADKVLQKTTLGVSAAFTAAGAWAFKQRRWWLAGIGLWSGFFMLLVGLGIIKETDF